MEELEQMLMLNQQGKRVNRNIGSMVYDIDYCGVIGDASEYLEDFKVYREAGPNDIVKIHINTPGGNFDTLAQLIANIRNCQAQVICFLEGSANSAGGALFLQGDMFVVSENCEMLIHESTMGAYDSSHKAHKQFMFALDRIKNAFRDWYKDFLTDDEMEAILHGDDIWLSSEEISERLEIKCAKPEEESFENKMDEGMRETLSTWTKKHLQMECDDADIPYTTKDTKKQLIEKLLK